MRKDCVIIFVFIKFSFFLTTVMHIINVTDFPLFCSNSARKCLILPAECSPQKSLILLEILPAEFIQAYWNGRPSCKWRKCNSEAGLAVLNSFLCPAWPNKEQIFISLELLCVESKSLVLSRLYMIVRECVVLQRVVVDDSNRRFDKLCGGHH